MPPRLTQAERRLMTPPEEEALHRLPPQNIEAEQAVLGAVLLDNAAFPKALEILKENHFYREAHRKIFSGMRELFERNEPIERAVVDYIAGMTDQFSLHTAEGLRPGIASNVFVGRV